MLKSKIKLTVISVIFLQLFLQMVSAQVITLSVSPSEYRINGEGTSCFAISFFNPHGDVDANYSLSPDDCLKNILTSYPKSLIVPKGTTISNSINSQLCINGDFTEKKECYLYVKGKPVSENNESGNLQIERQIAVRFKFGEGDSINPTTTTTTTTTTKTTTTTIKSQSGSSSNNTTTTKTTTTIKTTTTFKTTIKSLVTTTIQQNMTPEPTTTTIPNEIVEAGVNPSILGVVLLPILIVVIVGLSLFIKNKIDKKFDTKLPVTSIIIFSLLSSSVIASSMIDINVNVIFPTTTSTTTPLITTTTTTTTPIPTTTTLGFMGRTLGEFGGATGNFLLVMKSPLTSFILILGLVSFAIFLLYKIIEGIEFIFKN